VSACAVTPDGRRVISASNDRMLKLWDLETYACLLTHRGDAAYTAVAATTTSIVAGDSAGGVWFLDCPGAWRELTSRQPRSRKTKGVRVAPSTRGVVLGEPRARSAARG
jgi:WD40 repeat protein